MPKKRVLIVAVITTVIAIVLSGAWWYWQRPEKVVSDALEKLAQAQTQQFSVNMLLENATATTRLLGEQGQVEVYINGSFARQQDKRDSVAMEITLTSKTESVSVQIEGEMRFIEEQAYILIKKAPQAVPVVAQLKGAWIKLPRGGQQTTNQEVSDEQLFSAVTRQGNEKIGGIPAKKYQATATASAVLRLLDSVADILGTKLTEEQIQGIRQSLTEVQEVPAEFWITPWTHELQQLRTILTVPRGNTIRFTLTLNNRNKPVEIAAPEGAMTIEEALRAATPQQVPQSAQQPNQ